MNLAKSPRLWRGDSLPFRETTLAGQARVSPTLLLGACRVPLTRQGSPARSGGLGGHENVLFLGML